MVVMDELHKEGKFDVFGLSNYASWQVAEMCTIARERGMIQPTVYQAIYNPIHRGIEPELIPVCRRFGINIVIYNPLAGGLFSGKYRPNTQPTTGRFSNGAQGEQYRNRYFKDQFFAALDVIRPVAEKYNLTLVEVAFRWMMHHSMLDFKKGDGVIIGCSSVEQLESNLKDVEKGPLPEEVVVTLDDAWIVCKPYIINYFR